MTTMNVLPKKVRAPGLDGLAPPFVKRYAQLSGEIVHAANSHAGEGRMGGVSGASNRHIRATRSAAVVPLIRAWSDSSSGPLGVNTKGLRHWEEQA